MFSAPNHEPIPLAADSFGVIRIAGTRIPLETLIDHYEVGATPEEIVQCFPVLRLDDVYAVITYYLRHRQEVDDYLQKRQSEALEIRRKIDLRFPQTGLRDRLLARLAD